MWYYDLNGKPFGPVTKEIIVEEIRTGRIDQDTLIWREGWPQWKKLHETELSALINISVGDDSIINQAVLTNGNISEIRKIGLTPLSCLFWCWFGLVISTVPLLFLNKYTIDQSWLAGLTCVNSILTITSAVLNYILLYKFWQIIQDGFARTTPGKAVGYLFIPFYNFYWIFVAFMGLAEDLNIYIERHYKINEKVAIRKTHPIFSKIYILAYFLGIAISFVFSLYGFFQISTIRNNPYGMVNNIQPYGWILIAAILIRTGFMLLMFLDFFLTSKSILKANSNQISKNLT